MNALGRALLGGVIAVALAIGCSTKAGGPDSETHWLRVCNVDADCTGGLSCWCGMCTQSCTANTCDGPGKGAKCVSPTQVAAACRTPPSKGICTAACAVASDCAALGPELDCIGGACLVGSPASHVVDGGPAWQGAPCKECDLPTQVARLMDPASEDCGTIQEGDTTAQGADCARTALRAHRPFTLIIEGVGIDSTIGSAWVYESGQLVMLSYDSNVCGGTVPECASPGCGPQVNSTTCVDPTPSSAPESIVTCSAQTDVRLICGPVS